jgi:hypothetical protein
VKIAIRTTNTHVDVFVAELIWKAIETRPIAATQLSQASAMNVAPRNCAA